KLYIFGRKWLEDSVLTGVTRRGRYVPDAPPKILGFSPQCSCIELKNKAHRFLEGVLASARFIIELCVFAWGRGASFSQGSSSAFLPCSPKSASSGTFKPN